MKRSILFLLLISLAGTPAYDYALSWEKDDLVKMGITAVGAVALFYFFSNSSEPQKTSSYGNSHEFDEFAYLEDEQDSVPSEYFAQQRQPDPVNSKSVINLPACLCVGGASYFGYNYFQEIDFENSSGTDPKSTGTQSEKTKQSKKLEKKESVFDPTRHKAEPIIQVVPEVTLWEHAVNSSYSQITLTNAGCAIAFIALIYGLKALNTSRENPEAKQAGLYTNIERITQDACRVHEELCKKITGYERQNILTQQEACAVISYVTDRYNKIRDYWASSKSIARGGSWGGYKEDLTAADMANLNYYENKIYTIAQEIGAIDRDCRSHLKARIFGQILIEKFEPEDMKVTNSSDDQVDCIEKSVALEGEEFVKEGIPVSLEPIVGDNLESNSIINEESALTETQNFSGKKKSENVNEPDEIAWKNPAIEEGEVTNTEVDAVMDEVSETANIREQGAFAETQDIPRVEMKNSPQHPREWLEQASKKIKAEERIRDKAWVSLHEGLTMITVSCNWSWYCVKSWYRGE